MFYPSELKLINTPYFQIIRHTDDFIEIQSRNTKHCWIINKSQYLDKAPILIYHKHTFKTLYYHKHGYAYSVKSAIQSIKRHDAYVLFPEKQTMANQLTGHLN